jgi:hypothetical protein
MFAKNMKLVIKMKRRRKGKEKDYSLSLVFKTVRNANHFSFHYQKMEESHQWGGGRRGGN